MTKDKALTHAVEIAEAKRPGTWDDLLQYRALLSTPPAAPVQPVGVTTGCASHEGFFTVVFRSQQPIPDGTDLYTTPPATQRQRVVFPTMLRKMWSGGEVQAWLDETVNKENT